MKYDTTSFPLGGIGSGCIGIDSTGRLIDWEIFGKPNKESSNGFSHFAIKATNENGIKDLRVLQGYYEGPLMGQYTNEFSFEGFGWGVGRGALAGAPCFESVEFKGEFPIATLQYEDPCFPGKVTQTAFNPMIPLEADDSSLPVACFEFEIENTTEEVLTYTIAAAIENPLPMGTVNEYYEEGDVKGIKMTSDVLNEKERMYGQMMVATDGDAVDHQLYWYRGIWYEFLRIYWQDLKEEHLVKRTYDKGHKKDTGVLTSKISVKPNEKKKVKFLIAWYMPNCSASWMDQPVKDMWQHYYAKMFDGVEAVTTYAFKHWKRLSSETKMFTEAFYDSTLPREVIDAIGSNFSVLKSPTVLRLEDGTLFAFEGSGRNEGSCEGNCIHVWNYEYTLAYLYPSLERSMRELELKHNLDENGGLRFRVFVPFSRGRSTFRPCVDGQYGAVIQIYRDWKLSGDSQWLESIWSDVKRMIAYAWHPQNEDQWDPNQSGVITGRQHHTLDTELFGPNSWLTGFYLQGLQAGIEMAAFLKDDETQQLYQRILSKGKAYLNTQLFNGEYYIQDIDLNDEAILDQYEMIEKDLIVGIGDKEGEAYWFSEKNELKYQYGEGCLIDQVIADWHGNLNGLPKVFDQTQVQSALSAIYRYNFKTNIKDYNNLGRIYSHHNEGGTVVCAWPEGKHEPVIPMLHVGETMSGFEYQVACHMLQEGMEQEALALVKAIRDRHQGHNRNPWNEFECGSNYARALASYGLLLTYSGFSCDHVKGEMHFDPISKKDFKAFWSNGKAWGTVVYHEGEQRVTVLKEI